MKHNNYVVLDIETTMDHKEIRLAGLYVSSTDTSYLTESSLDFDTYLRLYVDEDTEVYTWNGARFDFRILRDVWGIDLYDKCKHVDGMLLAKMVLPDLHQYSLDAVARYLKVETTKGTIENYDTAPIPELSTYLIGDLQVTRETVNKLKSKAMSRPSVFRWRGAYSSTLQLEAKVAELCEEQCQIGVRFDAPHAECLVSELDLKMRAIEAYLEPLLPSWPIPKSQVHYPPKVQFKKDGKPSANIIKYVDKYGYKIVPCGSGYAVVQKGTVVPKRAAVVALLPLSAPIKTMRQISLSNQTDLKAWLLAKGWEPTEWNTKKEIDGKYKKTSPRLTMKDSKEPCPDLLRLGVHWIKEVSTWLMLRSRRNVLKSTNGTGWLNSTKKEGKVGYTLRPDADTIGANTARWTHKGVANIPRVSSPYGKEMRSLFCARTGKVWVGWDASSLEACMEAHYTYKLDKEYSDELMNGDPHAKNLALIGPLRDRDHAKTFKYGITYGAQADKVASILGVDKEEGKYWFDKFWDGNRALRELKNSLDTATTPKGWIPALDGRCIKTRSKHSRLNALFQSAGAIVMKYAMFIADMEIKRRFPGQAVGLIRYHDEEIWECDPEVAEEVGKIGVASVKAAGKYLKLNVPLDAEYKVGENWAEVH